MRRLVLGTTTFGVCLLLASGAGAAPATSLDRCLSALMGEVLRFADKTGQCLRQCEDAKRRGEIAANTRCKRPSDDPKTASCLARARERLVGASSNAVKRCTNEEVALFFGGTETCAGKNETVLDLVRCLAKKGENAAEALARRVYDPERPAVCGDGFISGFEQCDVNAYPNGCSGSYPICHPQYCYCTYSGCGNGILEFGEDCDYSAYPSGCSFFAYCTGACTCQDFGSASAAFLTESRDLIE
jgi:hypothetical protein